jgi:hypothetical protein
MCSYPSTAQQQAATILGWEGNIEVCDMYVILPAYATAPTTIVVYQGPSSSGEAYSRGVRIDTTTSLCVWTQVG